MNIPNASLFIFNLDSMGTLVFFPIHSHIFFFFTFWVTFTQIRHCVSLQRLQSENIYTAWPWIAQCLVGFLKVNQIKIHNKIQKVKKTGIPWGKWSTRDCYAISREERAKTVAQGQVRHMPPEFPLSQCTLFLLLLIILLLFLLLQIQWYATWIYQISQKHYFCFTSFS